MKLIKSSLLLPLIFLLSACGMKTTLYEKEFKEFFQGKDYVIMDVDDKVKSSDVINAIVAIKSDDTYKIEYYLFKDVTSARVTYANNKNNIKNSYEGNISEVTGKNYQKFYLVNDGVYKLVERVENTIIFINTDRSNKSEIDKLLGGMGY